jgi:hypothetical protein
MLSSIHFLTCSHDFTCFCRQYSLQELVRNQASAVIATVDKDDGPFNNMTIRRSAVLHDALRHMRVTRSNDVALPLRVTFLGEAAVDSGGPRREFSTLLWQGFCKSSLLDGLPLRRTFSHDVLQLSRETFKSLGQLFAITVLQGGSGLQCLSRPVAEYICFGTAKHMEIDDVPQQEVRVALRQVNHRFNKFYGL